MMIHLSQNRFTVKLSQLLMIGIPADNDLSAVRALQPGGVILMGRNAGKPNDVRRLTRQIAEACEETPLIATDQEGGRVQRLTDGFTPIPRMRKLGQQGARQVGITAAIVAAELRDVGVTVNFAPVCDVPVHPDDTVIGDRAFSNNPIQASLLAAEYIRGAQPTVLCCAKHFPGHGAVGVDSHKDLPTFEGTREQLAPHLQPFRSAIAAGVAAIMVGHIAAPALDDSGAPATLSQPIVTGLLRDEMNFRGLVVTDDLDMKALPQDRPGAIAVHALNAGCDLLLWCHSPDAARTALDAIQRALDDGTLGETRVRDALDRVKWAKTKVGILK
jgi:beta-N-acetylhexosaminidase